ncbi:integrase, partial [Escherichia coli]
SGKNIIRWLLKKRTNGSVRYCQYTSFRCLLDHCHSFFTVPCARYSNERKAKLRQYFHRNPKL